MICEQLITEVVRSVWRSRCRTYRHTVRPEDAKQEAFLACWRYRGKHDPSKSPARAYMWMVANHAIVWADNRAKKARKLVGKSLLSVDVGLDGDELSLLQALAITDCPCDRASEQEQQERVARAMSLLPTSAAAGLLVAAGAVSRNEAAERARVTPQAISKAAARAEHWAARVAALMVSS